jgi:hypothetical protein
MPAFPDRELLNEVFIARFLNHLRFTLIRLLREGSMTGEQLDKIVDLIKEDAGGST